MRKKSGRPRLEPHEVDILRKIQRTGTETFSPTWVGNNTDPDYRKISEPTKKQKYTQSYHSQLDELKRKRYLRGIGNKSGVDEYFQIDRGALDELKKYDEMGFPIRKGRKSGGAMFQVGLLVISFFLQVCFSLLCPTSQQRATL